MFLSPAEYGSVEAGLRLDPVPALAAAELHLVSSANVDGNVQVKGSASPLLTVSVCANTAARVKT